MNDWFQDPRAELGEAKSRDAERAARRNRLDESYALYREAADAFTAVAVSVPLDHPNTRGDLAVAAVACFGRAREFDRAVEIAQHFISQPGGISKGAHRELTLMATDYANMPRITPVAAAAKPSRPHLRTMRSRGRNAVRVRLAFHKEAG